MEKLSNVRCKIFSKQLLCACANRKMWSEIFSTSEVASIRMCEQTSLAMQPTYSESVMLVANYCRNTRNICMRNVWRRNMYRAVLEISENISKFQELTTYIMVYYGIPRRTLETWAYRTKIFPTVLVLAALLTSIWLAHHSHMHSFAK